MWLVDGWFQGKDVCKFGVSIPWEKDADSVLLIGLPWLELPALGLHTGAVWLPLGAFFGGLVLAKRVNPSISEGGGVATGLAPAASEVVRMVVATVVASE